MSTDNKALARRWFEEVRNQRRSDTIDELLTEESVCYTEQGSIRGIEEFKAKSRDIFLAAFPDLRLEIEGMVAEGDDVVVRWNARGIHAGDGLGFPPTGRSVSFRGMTWIRYRDGKMMEGWDCWDKTGLVHSLEPGSSPSGG